MSGAAQTGTAAELAQAHQAEQVAAQAEALAAIMAVWAGLEAANITRQWFAGASERIYLLLSVLQELLAGQAASYVSGILAAQGTPVVVPSVPGLPFAGVASDGRNLETLLFLPVIRTAAEVNRGMSEDEALARGAELLARIVQVQGADAGREADQVALTAAQPQGKAASRSPIGWIRCLTTPSCSRCVLLAGRWYGWNQGFQRH